MASVGRARMGMRSSVDMAQVTSPAALSCKLAYVFLKRLEEASRIAAKHYSVIAIERTQRLLTLYGGDRE